MGSSRFPGTNPPFRPVSGAAGPRGQDEDPPQVPGLLPGPLGTRPGNHHPGPQRPQQEVGPCSGVSLSNLKEYDRSYSFFF